MPDNEAALSIHVIAAEGLGDSRAALQDLRTLVGAQVARREIIAAARSLTQLFAKSAGVTQEGKTAREFYLALSQSSEHFEAVRDVIDALKISSPQAYEALKETSQGDVASGLFSTRPARRVSADEALSISLGAGLPRGR